MELKKRSYTPFLRPTKCPHVNGVYRNKESLKILVLKNVWLRGFIDGYTEEPYDAYQGTFFHENTGLIKKCLIEPYNLENNYERICDI